MRSSKIHNVALFRDKDAHFTLKRGKSNCGYKGHIL